ncbi:tryptophan transporter [Vagococcus xieshaowenii]|uniref:Tryptophan transporter n=1 Tax=Vagococcus xieshaowenii TaxID=2562451 RepID=A0A4Z0D6P0_9ENTE|nr:tryptophan transporter [Vagococcus xieshaowenii]QCA28639.1 hypothetical protein E4Z98_04640 [Vagococcus xieshaowenii]TFZ40553.1 hypothetical protein E4031_07135 [Vagococcus xieshaowenii]
MKTTKQTNILALTPIFIVLGQVLTLVTPNLLGVIRPDFALVFLFLCVIIHPTSKQVVVASILTMAMSLLAGGNPLFLLPSFADRLVSAFVCLAIYQLISQGLASNNRFNKGLLFFVSTLVSGGVYVLSVYIIGEMFQLPELLIIFKMGLPMLVVTILITAAINFFIGKFLIQLLALVSKKEY